MQAQTMKSEEARLAWRNILDAAHAGEDVVIQRYNKPTAVLISYEDYVAVLEELDEIRFARRAQKAYDEWKQDPTTAVPWEEAKAQLLADGVIGEEAISL